MLARLTIVTAFSILIGTVCSLVIVSLVDRFSGYWLIDSVTQWIAHLFS